jgi:hypothetical protein
MSEVTFRPLDNEQKRAYQDVSLGRPLDVGSTIEIAHLFADVPGLVMNWQTGLNYVPGNELASATSHGVIEGYDKRLSPDELVEHFRQQVIDEEVLPPSAYEPVTVPSLFFDTIRRGNFCRLVIKGSDVPAPRNAPAAGQVLAEKVAITRKLNPNNVPKANRPLRDISHDNPVGFARARQLAQLDRAATIANRELGSRNMPRLVLLGLGAFVTTIRVPEEAHAHLSH